jgi:hypothetical protein
MAGPSHPRRESKVVTASRPVVVARETATKSIKRIAPNIAQLGAFRLPRLRFLRDFSSVVRRMPGYKLMQRRGTARIPQQAQRLSQKCLYTVAHLEAATMPLWVQIPESHRTKLCPPVYVWLTKENPCIPVRSSKLRRNPVSVSTIRVIV